MDESFTQWRGGDKPLSKTKKNRNSSLIISDSEDNSDSSTTSNDQRKVVIESSDSENDLAETSSASTSRNNNGSSTPRSTKGARNRSESSNKDSPISGLVDLDETSCSLDMPIRPRIRGNRRMILDDSETDISQLKTQSKQNSNHSHFSDSDHSYEDSDHSHKDSDHSDEDLDHSHNDYSYEDTAKSHDDISYKDTAKSHDDISYKDTAESHDDISYKDTDHSDNDNSYKNVDHGNKSYKDVAKSHDDISYKDTDHSDDDNSYRNVVHSHVNKSYKDADHSPSEDIVSGPSNASFDLRPGSIIEDNSGVELLTDQKEIGTGSEEHDKSCLTISDTSMNEETSSIDLAAGHHARNSLTPIRTSENDAVVMSLIKKEVGVGNVDPIIAQKRAIISCNIQQVKSQLAKSKMLLNTANIELLPDKGEKLRHSINAHEAQLEKLSAELEMLPKIGTPKPEPKMKVRDMEYNPVSSWNLKKPGVPEPIEVKPLGQKALATQQREQTLTEERLKDLHGSLNARPGEDELADDPQGLKVSLMPHQRHALAWLLWRENQKPNGGILADDMGLGKTLTMISLIIKSLSNRDSEDDSDDDDDAWYQRRKSTRPKGGTLVVCPASVLSQWEAEINKRVRRGMLAVELFHGNNREAVPRRLAKNDVVITTYNLISREYNKGDNSSVLYEINWRRVILDEAHIVRNHKSQASEAVCNLNARARWALTGTPIQNKELDLYALLKFLKCSPFDDLHLWKRWVDNKNAHGHERLATIMKTLMLRRTKQELQAKGGLGTLPDKNMEEIHIKLDPEEQLVYEKVLVFSRTLFAQFLYQRAEKNHMVELNAGKFNAPTFLQKPKDTQFTKVQNQLLARHADVKAHEILVLLLRLRQVCCHPALIHAMLDQEDIKGNDIVDETGTNPDIMSGLGAMKLEDDENIDPNDIGVDRRVVENLLTTTNPIFKPERQSSKMRAVLNTIQEILDKGDKMVVVSQWTSMLEVVRSHLSTLRGASYDILSGNIPVKNRQQIMESFNKVGSNPQILLLSLTAGGVGLNLVGGNHLLLLDIHWNPQLEAQAQDRVYRVGQKKSVYIYKFICLDTVEQRIKALQEHKLAIAQGVLTGAGTAGAAKLTLDDLKSLFSL